MVNDAVLGAGGGGAAAAVEIGQKGVGVRLWNRSEATLRPFREHGGIRYRGVFGDGTYKPELITADLQAAIAGADGILVCLPTFAHAGVAEALAALGASRQPILLNPGHTGGVLAFREVFRRASVAAPPVAELSTLTYVARKSAPDTVHVTGAAKRVWAAALPGDDGALSLAGELYAAARPARDVLASGLCNVNMVLHPPGTVLGASWVEASGGDFTFYVQGLTDGVGRVMEILDEERRAVGAAFDHELPALFDEMQAIGTIEPEADPAPGLAAAIRNGKANARIRAPDTLSHRYYREDFHYGIKPFLVLAAIAGVQTPVASALMVLARTLTGMATEGRSAARMGITGLAKAELLALVR